MGKSGNNIAEHVRSAKMWLEKAEQSFDRQSDIQGELNLMLAEAEMKSLRKRHGLKMRAKLRVAAAMGIAVIAAGLWYAATRESPPESLPVRGVVPAVQPSSQALPSMPAEMTAQPEPYAEQQVQAAPAAMTRPTTSYEQRDDVAAPASISEVAPIQRSAPAPREVLTDAQIQQAVQDARHSLRGTDMKNK